MARKATNILWDVDCREDSAGLPTEITIPDEIADDDVGDYISDLTGYCYFGYVLKRISDA